jgi:hypothetical protein
VWLQNVPWDLCTGDVSTIIFFLRSELSRVQSRDLDSTHIHQGYQFALISKSSYNATYYLERFITNILLFYPTLFMGVAYSHVELLATSDPRWEIQLVRGAFGVENAYDPELSV